MTERYLGSIISPSPVEPSSNTENSTASGVWNIHDPLIFGQAEDWPDPSVPSPDKFVENLFSCFAYTGNGSTQSINNGIDLDGEGGLVWIKSRANSNFHMLFDTERGVQKYLLSSETDAQGTDANSVTAFNSNGFSLGSLSDVNNSSQSTVSWTFRKQPKFFDIVTYTGDGNTSQTISHNLGSTPGFMIAKQTNGSGSWFTYHRSLGAEKYLVLDGSGGGPYDQTYIWNDTAPTSTHFTVGNDQDINESGESYVAYLFAHNDSDGGFGSTGDQDIIKCGSYTGNGSTNAITVGFEPQWLLIKKSSGTADWLIADNVRGIHTGGNDYFLKAQDTDAEFNYSGLDLTSTGFTLTSDATLNQSSGTFIYVAIRRGSMQTPTAATSVFDVQKYTGDGTQKRKFTTNFVVDANITSGFTADYRTCWGARLYDGMHETSQTAISYSNLTGWIGYDHHDGYVGGEAANYGYQNGSSIEYISYSFSRAPKFFDVVTYAGNNSADHVVKHNLETTPEFIVTKVINYNGEDWHIYVNGISNSGVLNSGSSFTFSNAITAVSSTTMTLANDRKVNWNYNYVAYLFATLAGVSKVGTYSGTGNDVNVDCGFTNGARFVIVKRTDSSGDWYHWDSENGIVAGNDPYLLFNSDAAQVTNTDYIDPLSSGFTITSNAQSDLNTNGGTYLFLAIA